MSVENLTSVERSEESLSSSQNRSKMTKQKPKKVTIDLDEVQQHKDLSASMDSLDSLDGGQPVRTARDDVLESLGYKPNRIPKPNINQSGGKSCLCHYCGRKVYPMERIDVGEVYHKGCFKCHTCGLQLTLKTFCRAPSERNEIFCKSHVPKLEASYHKEAIEIQAAIKAQKKASEKVIKQYEPSPNKYDPDAIEFRHARDLRQRKKVKRRKSLKTTADYQKFGVFEAQQELEDKQRKEEDELYNEMHTERQSQLKSLETLLALEKEKTVKELITWFEDQNASEVERTSGLKKIEQYYKEQREQKIKDLLDKIHYEEQEAVTRLTEKHAQEMLFMIEEKDQEVTEELGKRQSHYARRSSYKDMEYYSEDGKMVTRSDEEEEEEEGGDDTENSEEVEEDTGKGGYKQSDHFEKTKREDEVSDRHHFKKSDKNREDTEDECSLEFAVKEGEYIQKKKKTAQDKEHYGLHEDDVSTERTGISTVKCNRENIQISDDRKYKQNKVKSGDEFPAVTEEIAEKKKPKKKKKNIDLEKMDYSTSLEKGKRSKKTSDKNTTTLNIQTNLDENQAAKQKINAKEPTTQHSKEIHTKDKTKDVEEEEEEEDDNDELETIEDRIKKVLKMNNMELSPESDDGDHEKGIKEDMSQQTKKVDKNIWTHGKVKDESSDLSSYSGCSKDKTSGRGRSSERYLQVTTGREKCNGSKESLRPDDEYSPRMSVAPSVEPPVCRKSKLYKNPEIFKVFDDHAFEEAQRDPTSFTDLVRRLSYKCENDLHKVRAIFRWITAKDLNKMEFSKDLSSNTPMGLLRGIKSGTETYHNLFKRLCSYVGIHCKIINGFSKGVGYRPGSKFRDGRFRNQWTAVWIKDSWRFINCNWGARHVKLPGDPHLTYKIDEFYFLTDPEDHIQQHFPDDLRWQLLKRSITIEEFVRMPVVKSPYFNNKLAFTSKTESILKAPSDGYVELRLYSPHLMSFAAKLQSRDHSVPESQLDNHSFIRMADNCIIFAASLPQPGRYYWDIFVDKKLNSHSMNNACSFLINCPHISSSAHKIQAYPQVCFGMTPESDAFNMRITPEFDPFLKVKGEMVLDLNLKSKSSIKTSLSLTFFDQGELKDIDCSQYALISCRTKTYLTCLVRCPQKGHYVLSLLAQDKNAPNSIPVPIYKFFLDCRSPFEKVKPLPHATSRWRDCKLVEPLEGELVVNSNVCFRVESSVAFEILVSVNDNWFSLQRVNNSWQGIINTGQKPGKIVIFGRFKEDNSKYIPFVEYLVKEASIKDEVHALFKYMN